MATDPRVGSARNNSTSPGLSRLIQGSNSPSVNSLLATIIPVTLYAFACLIVFLFLRRKCPRVYSPRARLSSLRPCERTPELPNGWFNWIKPFYKIPDTHVLNHSSIDGYLFLRFLRVLGIISVVGCVLTWPILIPIHATGGNGNQGLEILVLGNVSNPRWYYAHAAVAWVYFGFILYMVSRECIFYVNLRQAYLASPFYAKRLSSRTVLFTSIPLQYLDEQKLRKLLGDSVRRVWIARYSRQLGDLVKERRQTAERLEKAEVLLIKLANTAKASIEKKLEPPKRSNWRGLMNRRLREDADVVKVKTETPVHSIDAESLTEKNDFKVDMNGPLPNVNGSVASQWLSHKSRPYHRPIANYGRRVDTIKWTRIRLKTLSKQIRKLRRELLLEPGSVCSAAFVEFDSQEDAQVAYQTLPHHRPFQMSPRFIGVRPFEVVWSSLSLQWRELAVRKFLMRGCIAVLVIFWALPCALVASISNLEYLGTRISFLSWVNKLPAVVLGLASGLLPAVALSLLMSIVPGIVRLCAKTAGTPTLTLIELYTQSAYFIFQIVQVFLVTTLTSAISTSLANILENPPSAATILSGSLPKASNFYLSYFFVQCTAFGATSLLHLLDLFKFHYLQSRTPSPRKMYKRWHTLQRIHWGSIFPVYTNLGVIAITYSCIAPVVLGFAALGTCIVHSTYRYNLLFSYDSEVDTKGLVYPRALMQLLTGVYFAALCLTGLFALRQATGPVIMAASLLVFTFIVQLSLLDAMGPLLDSLPRTLAAETEHAAFMNRPTNPEDNLTPLDYFDVLEDSSAGRIPEEEVDEVVHEPGAIRGLEGASGATHTLSTELKPKLKAKLEGLFHFNEVADAFGALSRRLSPDPEKKPNFVYKWLFPQVYSSYTAVRRTMPPDLQVPEYEDEIERLIYYPPLFSHRQLHLWIPRDDAGVSTQEVLHSGRVIGITDEGATIDQKGKITVDYGAEGQEDQLEQWRY